MNFANNKGKKKNLQHKGKHRAPRGNPFKINASARQRKGRKKAQNRQNSRAETNARKQTTKTATQFVFIKPLQPGKKRREKSKRQEKIISNGK